MPGRNRAAKDRVRSNGRADDEAHVRLIARISERDLRAFEDLYRDLYPKLSRFLQNILHSASLVEEVFDDAMLVVWNHADRYNGRSKVSTWVFAIAYRKALKALARHDPPVEDPGAKKRPSAEAGPEQAVERRQAREGLRRAMAKLSDEHRAVVGLTYYDDISYGEIARIIGCPVGTVKTRMFHARRQLRRSLNGGLSDWL